MNELKGKTILLFDGVCHVCNASVAFLLRHDRKGRMYFAPYQSETGRALSAAYGLSSSDLNSVAVIHNEVCYTKTAAVVQALKLLGSGWVVPAFLMGLVPTVVSNAVYDWVARNRYKWFGQKEACMIPTPAQRKRFL
jgi:predicted DCC family thiol-disulfide oxidoreductase YuxK